jgi:(E)-4-hydroxy-3-methylbut-2-enyl-diphosphate synthase
LEDLKIQRKISKSITIGNVQVGGGSPIRVQSMTSTPTQDINATISQIKALEFAGCEIVRVAVPDLESARAISQIKKETSIPIIADIHFDHRLGIAAIKEGVDGIRVNPGNIKKDHFRELVTAANNASVVIRLGVNAGSLEKDLLAKFGGPTAGALVESAMRNIHFFEDLGFDRLKISIKSSHVPTMVTAYRDLSNKTIYPLHLGVTEAGSIVNAAIKSSIGIGLLLSEGIGDTIRVSVTGNPVQEIPVAFGILRALDIRRVGADVISCPTCGRCKIELAQIVQEVEKRMSGVRTDLKVALMGCIVNGPGEAAEADIGIAGGRGEGILFKRGKVIKKIKERDLITVLFEEINKLIRDREEQS